LTGSESAALKITNCLTAKKYASEIKTKSSTVVIVEW